ncbi:MAG: hypothetical protein N2442_07845 [Spirochaetes bacterium]|nr:hypothetical protein [Spirochaetota bacterium]
MDSYRTRTIEPPPKEMLEWIRDTFSMTQRSMSWMFQVHPQTIHSWLQGGWISRYHRMKIRKSYYFLTGKQDPYAGLIFCESCHTWKESRDFKDGNVICMECKGERH